MPKVLLLSDGLHNGGAERQMALLAKCIPVDWQCRVWAMDGGPYTEVLREAHIPVRLQRRTSSLDVRPTWDLCHALRAWRPDVVHSWGWMSSAAAGPLCRLLDVAFVDGTIRMGMRPPRRALGQSWGMRWADRILANSQAGLAAWRISPSRGRVVYNGFDPDRLPLEPSDEWSPDRPFTVAMVARMDPAKDFHSFFTAARHLARTEGYGWRFLAVGHGPSRNALISETRDLIEAGIVEFPEAGLEVVPLLLQAQIGVLMSNPALHAEGCSNAIMEYMACGLPVVCSESGGNREIVLEGRTGFIIPPTDVTALASRISYLRRESAQGRTMGMAGRERLCSAFSLESMVSGTLDVYSEAMQVHA